MARNIRLGKGIHNSQARENKVAIIATCSCYKERFTHTDGELDNPGVADGGTTAEYECTCGYQAKQIRQQAAARQHRAKRAQADKTAAIQSELERTASIGTTAPDIRWAGNPKRTQPATAIPNATDIDELRFYKKFYRIDISLREGRERWIADANKNATEKWLTAIAAERKETQELLKALAQDKPQGGGRKTATNLTK